MPIGNPTAAHGALTSLEKYLEAVTGSFSAVARKEGGLRDAYDDIARANMEFVRGSNFHNPSTKSALESYSKHLVAAQDYRQAKLAQIEHGVLPLLVNLSTECKQLKNMKSRSSLSGSEQRLSSGAKDDANNTKQSGSLDALAQAKKSESEFINFERTKLQQLKKALTDALVLDLAFHSRAIEQLSPILTALHDINIEADLHEYCKTALGISSGGPAGVRSESAMSYRSSTGSTAPTKAPAQSGSGPVTTKVSKPAGNNAPPPEVHVSTSFDDDEVEDEYEEEYEGDTTESAAAGPGWSSGNRGQQPASSGRPLTGNPGPAVPQRTTNQRMPNMNLFTAGKK